MIGHQFLYRPGTSPAIKLIKGQESRRVIIHLKEFLSVSVKQDLQPISKPAKIKLINKRSLTAHADAQNTQQSNPQRRQQNCPCELRPLSQYCARVWCMLQTVALSDQYLGSAAAIRGLVVLYERLKRHSLVREQLGELCSSAANKVTSQSTEFKLHLKQACVWTRKAHFRRVNKFFQKFYLWIRLKDGVV